MMKEKEMKRVPKLRFPEFTYDWEQRKVPELLKNSSSAMKIGPFGSALKKEYFVKEGVKVYAQENAFTGDFSIGDYYITEEKYKELQSCELYPGDLVISMMGTIGSCAIFPETAEKGIMNSHLLRLQFSNEVVPQYIMYLLRDSDLIKKQIDRLSVGSIMSGLSSNVVKKLVFPIPKLPEQKKIVEYLDNLDHLIILHQRKLEKLKELRKGVMKKLFNQEVRFKADDESEFPEWEKKKIGDVFSQIKDKNKDGRNQNVITNSAEFGLINQRDFFDKDIAVDGKTENYTVIKTGDFVYNPRKSKQAPYGPFNCYQLEENGIVSPLYTCLRPKSNVNDKYLLWYFKSGSWYRFIYENGAQNGARHDRVGMTDSLMQEIPVYLPQALEEQQKIADCLLSLDDVIAKQKATLAAWEELKKGLLQQMFV